ncbi:NAD(P)/FAD-dependent oxidoreductase [Niabella drilacis]|uniref:D-amino-acid dehydrogenase n=1 Tax=Niabella drilacis (strain DSM 25811 / CCM 8410 / CCUG 62505 / LMG 26954 / E90) TaxID=1285928 RepID=A0A1G6R9Q5_NIADE|nr:FAD-dependent oxidoreductase [Niabella drilacis]SDD00767.1 D-amino-acid dehydrogenase [Niabella drilacis]
MKVVIIGAGIAGLSAAYYLNKEGWDVQVLEKGDGLNNCSYGNAGMIVPSHFTPLAAPGIVSQGIKWMLSSKSPFYVRPSLNLSLLDWGIRFLKHTNEKHVSRSAGPVRDLNLYSSRLYDELAATPGFDFELRQNGIMMLYKTAAMAHEEAELAEKAQRLGLEVAVHDKNGIRELEPGLEMDVAGGVLYRCDGILYPPQLMRQLTRQLLSAGVQIHYQTEVTGFKSSGRTLTEVVTTKGDFKADEVVVATGYELPELASVLQLKLPLMPGKGYSFMYHPGPGISMIHGALLLEARVAVTPMNGQIRFSGTMELGPANNKIYSNRVRGIVEAVPRYFPGCRPAFPTGTWYGYRPCPPDGLPYLGRVKKINNLSIAGGGGMMGLSLGPAYGKTIANILSGKDTATQIEVFNPDRF